MQASSREAVLGRVRRALAADPGGASPEQPVVRAYLREHGSRTVEETVDLLAENLADYRAIVHRVDAAGLAELIARLLSARGVRQVLVPEGLPPYLLADTDAVVVAEADLPGTAHRDLERIDSVITGCALAVAETGTIVLDGGPGQGRRRATLIPDHHICLVRVPDQVVASVPQALDRLTPTRPQTWISGPSATSDIELSRVEGVHGPRTLEVILLTPPTTT